MDNNKTIEAVEVIDIEALLMRAYWEKRIDRLDKGAASRAALGLPKGPKAPGAVFSMDTKVDTSSYSARVAAEMREMFLRLANAPDALLTLHDHVLALPDFFVELGAGVDFVVWDVETATRLRHLILDPKGDLPRIVTLRTRRDRATGEATLVPYGEPRALTRIVTTTLLTGHARECQRPGVSDVVVTRMRPIYRGGHKAAVGYLPEHETPLDVVAMERARYAVWHVALGMVRDAMGSAPGLDITGPSAPPAPWELERRVLDGCADVVLTASHPDDGEAAKPLPRKRKAIAAKPRKVAV